MNESKLLVWHKEELEKDLDMLVKHNLSEEDSEGRLSDYALSELLDRLRNDNEVIRVQQLRGSVIKPYNGSLIDGQWHFADWLASNWRRVVVFLSPLVAMSILFDRFTI